MNAKAVMSTLPGLLVMLFSCHLVSLGCKCVLPKRASAKQQINDARKRSTAVFSGTVLEVISEPNNVFVLVRFKVEKLWKGNNASQVAIRTGRGSGDCGLPFAAGERYLVYAYGPENALETNICQRTTSLSDAAVDLRILDEGRKAKAATVGKLSAHIGDRDSGLGRGTDDKNKRLE
jgi:hypothetical protein